MEREREGWRKYNPGLEEGELFFFFFNFILFLNLKHY